MHKIKHLAGRAVGVLDRECLRTKETKVDRTHPRLICLLNPSQFCEILRPRGCKPEQLQGHYVQADAGRFVSHELASSPI